MSLPAEGAPKQEAHSILREIFVFSWDMPLGPERKRFRAGHPKHLDLLDELERSSDVIVDHDHYYIHFLILTDLLESTPQAGECLEVCGRVFLFLKARYEETFDERVAIREIAEQIGVPVGKVIKAMRYVAQASVLASRSTNMDEDGATVSPGESVLRHDSFGEVIEEVRGWQAKAKKAHQTLAPVNVRDEPIPDLSGLLHPIVAEKALKLLQDGHLREAVLNSIMAVFHLIQERTGLTEDGDTLAGKSLSLRDPYLILTEVDTESGRNDQQGFMKILQGAYQGIRNPKAHRLTHDLTGPNAAQYLVFASLLARRIDDAKLVRREAQEEH